MRLKNRKFETFGDGILAICEVSERSLVKTRHQNVRFGDKTVGVTRFFQAKVASDQISKLVAVPAVPGVRQTDVVLIGGAQYRIVQIQDKFDACPPCLYLSLAESKIVYKDVRTDESSTAG